MDQMISNGSNQIVSQEPVSQNFVPPEPVQLVEVKKNSFGDVIVTLADHKTDGAVSYNDIPSEDKERAIYIGFIPPGSVFLAHHPVSGPIYGFSAFKTFPFVYESKILGSVGVVTTRYNDKTWFIVVKPRNRKYLMNPAGSVNLKDVSGKIDLAARRPADLSIIHLTAARAEVREETGCIVEEMKELARWENSKPYASFKWGASTICYHGVCDTLPQYIKEALDEDPEIGIHILDLPDEPGYDNQEISHVVVFSEPRIEEVVFKGIEIDGETFCLGEHHGAVALKVAGKYGPENQQFLGSFQHLTMFRFS